jgi:glycosyltransferase involved in cell wall biosynthesis
MNNKLTLSIITVVNDDIDGFRKTIESLIQTPWEYVEFIVVDSSRTKETSNLFQSTFVGNQNAHYFWVPPVGIYPAMNFGLRSANGRWIWFLNAGDVLSDEVSIFDVISDINENKSSNAIAYSVQHVARGQIVWSVSIPEIVERPPNRIIEGNHQGFIAKVEVISRLGGFDEFYKFAADSKLMDQIAKLGEVSFPNRVLSKFQIGGTSSKNFGKVLMEIAHHRGTKRGLRFFVNYYKLVLKNKARLMILKLEPVFIEEILKRKNRL